LRGVCAATFTVDGGFFSDKHHAMNRLDETDLWPR
jgi:hypothetical protein